MAIDLKIVSLNVRGLNDRYKRMTLFKWLKDKKFDIICLQETFCVNNFVKTFDRDWQGSIYHCTSNSTHARGVCIMFRKNINFKLKNLHSSVDGRKILMNIEISDQKYTIANLYSPTIEKEKCDFQKKTGFWINKLSMEDSSLILAGDFNSVLSSIDRSSNKEDTSSKHFRNMIHMLNVSDTWRYLYGNKKIFTYADKSRIDYIFISPHLKKNLKSVSICKAPKIPDHRAVCIDLNENICRGKGYWKLNISVLKDEAYRNAIKSVVHDTVNEYKNKIDSRLLWDFCKIRIKEFSITYSIKKSQQYRNKIEMMEDKIQQFESKIHLSLNNEEKQSLLLTKKKIEQEYDQIYEASAKGAQVRSRAKYVEDGERNSKYFLNLEKNHQNNNSISSIKNELNEQVTDRKEILDVTTNFYTKLYESKDIPIRNMNTFISHLKPKHILSNEESNTCEGKVSYDECQTVIKHMSKNKSPGLDGLPSEFYQCFWQDFGMLIVESYNEAFKNGILSESQKRAVITLIFKKGDRQFLKNYRPISLTNCDYKILAFVLATRLQKVIDKIVSDEQTAYIKKRFIGENIRLLEDMIEYTDRNNIPGVLLFLDFEKAFDSIEWNFIFKTLELYNFGPEFQRWIKILYTEPSAVIKLNGWLSKDITLSRGIRQGCPISALLFILATEMLSLHIKQDDMLKGIKIKADEKLHEIRISQYADDTTLFLKDQYQVSHALKLIQEFCDVAGPNLNVNKTEGLFIGNIKNINIQIGNIKWTKNSIRYLGIYIGHNIKENHKLNWENKLDEMQKLLDNWRKRDLTLFGKVSIVKSLAIPKLIFSATMLDIPDAMIKQINKIIYNFIWNGRDRICRKTLIGKIEDGGINMIDI